MAHGGLRAGAANEDGSCVVRLIKSSLAAHRCWVPGCSPYRSSPPQGNTLRYAQTMRRACKYTIHRACEYSAQSLRIHCTKPANTMHWTNMFSHGDPMEPQSWPLGAPRGPMGPHGDPPNDILKKCTILSISHGGPKWSHGCPKWFQRSSHGAPSGPMGKQTTFSENAQACWTLFKIECSGLFYIGSTGTCMCICVCIKGNGPCVHAW